MSGNGSTTSGQMQACGALAGVMRPAPTAKNARRQVLMHCNRPCGHDGPHAWSTDRQARLYEWRDDGTMLRVP